MNKMRSLLQTIIPFAAFLMNGAMADSECATLKCMNGGTCYTQISGDSIVREYCICPSDKQGETCEEHKQCDLNCIHGECLYPFTPSGSELASDTNKEPFCKCDEGYTGILCESEVEVCPGGERRCYNGGVCKELFHTGPNMLGQPFENRRFKCDCSVIDPTSPFAGLECEHPAEQICSLMTIEKNSYCVNGGTCKDIVFTEDLHRGCDCPKGFEGEHCEFVEGTNPEKVTATSASQSSDTSSKAKPVQRPPAAPGLNGASLFAVVLTLSASFAAGVVTAYRMKKKRLALQEATMAYDDHDLAFDADGNRMSNISISDPAEREGEVI